MSSTFASILPFHDMASDQPAGARIDLAIVDELERHAVDIDVDICKVLDRRLETVA